MNEIKLINHSDGCILLPFTIAGNNIELHYSFDSDNPDKVISLFIKLVKNDN